MKKYIGCIAIAMLTVGLLTGCGSGIELTDEENNMVAEYMAAALLRYDLQYEKELIYTENIEEEEEFVSVDQIGEEDQKEESSKDNQTSNENVSGREEDLEAAVSVTLDEIFDDEKYKVEYAGMKEYATYKEEGNEYFIVEAPSGCKLAVVQFKITNTSSEDVKVDLAEKEIIYSFSAEGITGQKPLLTALMGDLQYYNETIPAGESKMAVVLFAVDKDADISNGTMSVEKKGQGISRFTVAVGK